MDKKQIIGNNIKRLLKEKNITQRELADGTYITEVSLSRFIAGDREPKATQLLNIAKFFGITVAELCSEEMQFDALADAIKRREEDIAQFAEGPFGNMLEFPNAIKTNYINAKQDLAFLKELQELRKLTEEVNGLKKEGKYQDGTPKILSIDSDIIAMTKKLPSGGYEALFREKLSLDEFIAVFAAFMNASIRTFIAHTGKHKLAFVTIDQIFTDCMSEVAESLGHTVNIKTVVTEINEKESEENERAN